MSKIVIDIDRTVDPIGLWSRVMCVLLAAYSFFGGAVSLIGWIADVPRLTDWGNHGISIQPNTTVAVMASAAALALLWRGFNLLGRLFGTLVALIGIASLFQIVTGIRLSANTWLMFERSWGQTGVISPGQIGMPGSVSWTFVGLSIILISLTSPHVVTQSKKKLRLTGIGLALSTLGISALSIAGYLFGAEVLYTVPRLTVIAFQTATFIFALSMAIILSVSDAGPMRLFGENSIAGSMVRRVVPAIIVVPIVLGLLRLAGERAGLYDLAFGSAARTLLEIAFLLSLLWWAGRTVNREERRAELHLREARESDRELRHMADAMPQVVWIADPDGTVNYYNQRVEEFGGVEQRSADRFDWQPSVHPDDLPATLAAWQAATASVQTYAHEHRILMADGTYRWHLSRAIPIKDHEGQPSKWFGTATDVHDLKMAEEAVRKTEERLRLAVNAGQMGVWENDTETKEIIWDTRTRELFGVTPDEKITYETIWRIIPDEEHSYVRVAAQQALDGVGDGIYDVEHRVRLQDGSIRWLHNLGRVEFTDNGDGPRPLRMRGTVADVTERKREETRVALLARLGDLIRTSDDPAALLHAVSQAVCDNLNARRCFFNEIDLEAETETVHRDYFRGVESIAGIHKINDLGSDAIAQMKAGRTVVTEDTPSGRVKPNLGRSSVAVPLMRGGKWVASFRVNDDLPRKWSETEIRLVESIAERAWLAVEKLDSEAALLESKSQLEARVAERTKELAETNRALLEEMDERAASEKQRIDLLHRLVSSQEFERRRIARDIHDQLGQTLTALRLKIASLREVALNNPDLAPRVERLQEIAEKLDSEVSFLAWELRPTALDDLGFVDAISEYVREWSKHCEIDADFHASDLAGVRLDREAETHLYRITQEALNNVAKHAKAEHVTVLLERRDDRVVLVIEDNGEGFDPLELVHSTESGSGLGLIGMNERAALVQGDVEIESSVGNGTTIYVRVPHSE